MRRIRRVGLLALAMVAILAASPLLFTLFWIDDRLSEAPAR